MYGVEEPKGNTTGEVHLAQFQLFLIQALLSHNYGLDNGLHAVGKNGSSVHCDVMEMKNLVTFGPS